MATMSTAEGATKTMARGLRLHVDFSNRRSYSPNLMNYSIWSEGSSSIAASASMFGITQYTLNGQAGENIRVVETDPFGYTSSIVWRSSTVDPALVSPGQPDGGWNSGYIDIDNRKTYRFSVWMKKNTGIANSGTVYLGHTPRDSSGSGTNSIFKNTGFATTNPYFHYVEPTSPPFMGGDDVWTLVVGHVWPRGTATGSLEPGSNISNTSLAINYAHPDTGVWTAASGKIGNARYSLDTGTINNSSDWIWNPGAASVCHRAYLYYGDAQSPPATASFIYPRIDVVDGFEPAIADLLQGPEPVRNLAERRTGRALHHTNWSPAYNGCLRMEKDKFMGFHGTMSSPFTIYAASVWFMTNVDITNSTTGMALFHLSSGNDQFGLYLGSSTFLVNNETILLADGLSRTAAVYVGISKNVWHNITVNWNSTKYDIYLDGTMLFTSNGGNPDVPLKTTDGYATIGGRFAAGAAPLSFDGRLSSVMAWDRPLSEAEIASMWRAGSVKLR